MTEAQNKQVERVREEISDILCKVCMKHLGMLCLRPDPQCTFKRTAIKQILSKLAILDEDQSLPEIKHETYADAKEQLARDHYEAGWNNGVNNAFHLNFRRIIPK